MKITSQSMVPTVFVVDDDPSIREALSSLIRSVNLGVETFSSAQEFLRHNRPDAPACLVLDVRLRQLLTAIKRVYASTYKAAAKRYLAELARAGRYQRDVY